MNLLVEHKVSSLGDINYYECRPSNSEIDNLLNKNFRTFKEGNSKLGNRKSTSIIDQITTTQLIILN